MFGAYPFGEPYFGQAPNVVTVIPEPSVIRLRAGGALRVAVRAGGTGTVEVKGGGGTAIRVRGGAGDVG